MTEFNTAKANNALIETSLFFKFAREFGGDEMNRLNSLRSLLIDELPFHYETNAVSFEFKAAGKEPSSAKSSLENVGFELRDKEVGEIDWVFRVTRNDFSIHCTNYTTWNEVSEKLLNYSTAFFRALGYTVNPVTSLGMKFFDGFNIPLHSREATNGNHGVLTQTDPSIIFTPSGKRIPNYIFDRPHNRFHSHLGWFSENKANRNTEILNKLNVDSGFIQKQGAFINSVTISHTQAMFGKDGLILGEVLGEVVGENNKILLNMNEMHNKNKRLLRKNLSPKALKKMGLDEEKS